MKHDLQHEPEGSHKATSRAKWVLIGFLLIAGYFLLTEHRAHLSGWLSSYGVWVLLLACPLMHLFMHGGHGGHGGPDAHDSHPDDRKQPGKTPYRGE